MNSDNAGRYWTCYQCLKKFYSTVKYTSLPCCGFCQPDMVNINSSKLYSIVIEKPKKFCQVTDGIAFF